MAVYEAAVPAQTQRKHSPDSFYEYSFVTFSREVIGIYGEKRQKTSISLSYLFTIIKLIQIYIQQQIYQISHSMVPNQKIKETLHLAEATG